MKIGILLSGCGVFDGSEIQEAVLAMLAIKEAGHDYVCIGVDEEQHHVINHTNGQEMPESRNMLVEAARIARGNIQNINFVSPADLDAVVLPGGFGVAKNFSDWAFEGPKGSLLPEVKLFLVNMVNVGKPVCALCVSPIVVAKALEGTVLAPVLTLGTDQEASPYDIPAFNAGIESIGAKSVKKGIAEIHVDRENLIVSAPCYMQETNILAVYKNIQQAVAATLELCV